MAHIVLFSEVIDITLWKMDLKDPAYTHTLPDPQTSSLLAYLRPARYWHNMVDHLVEPH